MNKKIITLLLVAVAISGCATNLKKPELVARAPIKTDHERVYFVRTNSPVLTKEKGLSPTAKVGLLVVAAVVAGATAGQGYMPVYVPNDPGKNPYDKYDIYRASDQQLTPLLSLSSSEKHGFIDLPINDVADFVVANYSTHFLARGYSKNLGLLRIRVGEIEGFTNVVTVGDQQKKDGFGFRNVLMRNEDVEYCRKLPESTDTYKEMNKQIRQYSAKFVASDSHLKSSYNFTVVCNAIISAVDMSVLKSSEKFLERSEIKTEKLNARWKEVKSALDVHPNFDTQATLDLLEDRKADAKKKVKLSKEEKLLLKTVSNAPIKLVELQ